MANGADKSVTQVMDMKGPLRGEGGMLAQWRADAAARLAQLHCDMAALAAASKTIAGRQWSLNICLLRVGRQLRWRMTCGRHATWEGIWPLMANLPPGLVRWCCEAEELAQWLNRCLGSDGDAASSGRRIQVRGRRPGCARTARRPAR
jgi:hypothetical protein